MLINQNTESKFKRSGFPMENTYLRRNCTENTRKKTSPSPRYEGQSKEEIRKIKKEKRSRRLYQKYKDKLIAEQQNLKMQFTSCSSWNRISQDRNL